MKAIISFFIFIIVWQLISALSHSPLLPSASEALIALVGLFTTTDSWRDLVITFYRIILGLGAAFVAAVFFGVLAGLKKGLIDYFSPFAFIMQSCPVIIWISLLIVWAGIGSLVPIIAVFLATFPILFFNIMQGVSALDRRLFKMAELYQVRPLRILKDVIWDGIANYVLAGLAISLSLAWKVASTAEFIGSTSGVGSKIYWSYKLLDIQNLFAWALMLVIIGVLVDYFLVRPIRGRIAGKVTTL